MFYGMLFGLGAFILYRAMTAGPRNALWAGWPVALMLMPAWMTSNFGSIQYDLRTGAAVAVLLGFFLFAPRDPAPAPWVLSDLLLGGLIAVQAASQYAAHDFRPFTLPDFARRWLLPYLMGRFFLTSAADMRAVMPVFCRFCLVLSVYAVFEAFLKVNPVNVLLGKTYGLLEQGEGYRMGLKRAQGPLDHPIFFGMMLVMIFPWTLEAAFRSREPGGRWWWRYLPWVMGAALFCTVSRGPQIATLFSLLGTVFFRFPRWRVPFLVAAVVGAVALYSGRELVEDGLGAMAGETDETVQIIMIDGEPTEYTGTKHRILLFTVYADALEKAGWLGFGFKMADVRLEESVADRFGSIDNHYMLFYLRHGYLGIGAFGAVALCSLYYLGRAAWDVRRPDSRLAACLFGALAGVDVLLMSVWFSPDFGATWLFSTGLAAAIHLMPATPASVPVTPEATSAVRPQSLYPVRRLVPGHAPVRV